MGKFGLFVVVTLAVASGNLLEHAISTVVAAYVADRVPLPLNFGHHEDFKHY